MANPETNDPLHTPNQPGSKTIWGPFVSNRQWGTVWEDYSADGTPCTFLAHDMARSKAYRWSVDGIAGICTIFFLAVLCLQCVTTRHQAASDRIAATALQPFGRTLINGDRNLELISSASHFGFSFEGKECSVTVSVPSWLQHNYLQYEVDGVYQKRIPVSSKEGEKIIITAPDNGRHTVWIYKATEAHTGAVVIQDVMGKRVKPLRRPAAPLIEFIGNSITCGAAADPSKVPCGSGAYHDQHNAYMSYGPRVARAVGANYLLSSVSGIGVYRNWNSNGPTMPEVYDKVDFRAKTIPLWDFSVYTPKVVSIALGTNDFSRGDGKTERLPFDSTKFVNAYVDFVQSVKTKYPSAQIALLSSPMVGGDAGALFQNCLLAVKANVDVRNAAQKPVALFFFKPMQPSGCTGHPSVEEHAIMAEQLLPFFQKLLR